MRAIGASLSVFGDMSDILYVHYYALISFCDSALPFADQVRIHLHFGYPLLHILILICACLIRVFIVFLIDCHVSFGLLVETRLYGLRGVLWSLPYLPDK